MSEKVVLPRLKLFITLWVIGIVGAALLTVTILPQLLEGQELPAPIRVIVIASIMQSAVLVGIATWVGVHLASSVGLHAPVFEAIVLRQRAITKLTPQILPGFLLGFFGGVLLYISSTQGPDVLIQAAEIPNIPLLSRLLYGGITEELLLRWGLMSLLVWILWRFIQKGAGVPRPQYIWVAIFLSAFIFGAGHLPAASMLAGGLSLTLTVYIIVVNSIFGIMFGWLYWRHGLESAMIAHATSHLINYLLI